MTIDYQCSPWVANFDGFCDDCLTPFTYGDAVYIYHYWDLPGPEFVCPSCKPEHDAQDRLHGYLED